VVSKLGDYSVYPSLLHETFQFLSRVSPVLFPKSSEPIIETQVAWTCLMSFSAADDHLPLYGQVGPGLFLAMGLGPQGIERGPQLGALLAEGIVSTKQHSLLAPFNPLRKGSHVHVPKLVV